MKAFTGKNKIFIAIGLFTILIFSLVIYKRGIFHKPNIIFITIDALRPMNLHCYGYERETSPNIDKLVDQGSLFLNCFSAAPNTLWSSPSFLTGKYIWSISNILNELIANRFSYKFTTLAEYLKFFGYHSAAFVNNANYLEGSGFEQGFDDYKCYLNLEQNRNPDRSEEISKNILNFLENYKGNKPLFIWVHYLSPHAPYTPPDEYRDMFIDDKLYAKDNRVLELQPNEDLYPYESRGYIPRLVFDFEKNIYSANYYIANYDSEIRYVDFCLGKLLDKLGDNFIIILSADHGESLGEHNVYFSHGENLYSEILHVPLIIKDKKYFKPGKKIDRPVSLLDIVPTILKRVNPIWYFFNKQRFDGRDLQTIVKGKNNKRKFLFAYAFDEDEYYSIFDLDTGYKYIGRRFTSRELYKLPDEDTNLIDDWSSEVISEREKLIRAFTQWLKDRPVRADFDVKDVKLSPKEMNDLRSLGYLH